MPSDEAKQGASVDNWNEYRRLVLAELERLTQVIEKMRDQHAIIDKEQVDSENRIRNDLTKLMDEKQAESVREFKKELSDLEKRIMHNLEERRTYTHTSSKWGFWSAVISIIGSFIVSTISLIVALS